ncbi:MAG TPA: hypothetical protein VKR58_04780 [Aquella sp.]|nr:hypothetical protein [Aquella sp.]
MIKLLKKLFCRHLLLEELSVIPGVCSDWKKLKCIKCEKSFVAKSDSDFTKQLKENLELARKIQVKENE